MINVWPGLTGYLSRIAKASSLLATQADSGRSRKTDDTVTGPLYPESCDAVGRSSGRWDACSASRRATSPANPFVFEDLDAYVLYHWLRKRKTKAEPARRIVRALLIGGGSAEELLVSCIRDGVACRIALEYADLALPAADGSRSLDYGDVFVVAEGGGQALTSLPGPEPSAILLTNANTPVGAIDTFARDLVEARPGHVFLAVASGSDLRAFEFWPGGSSPFPHRKWDDPSFQLHLKVDVRDDRLILDAEHTYLEFEAQGDCHSSPRTCYAIPELSAELLRLKTLWPADTMVTITLENDLPVQVLASVLERVSGEDCRVDAHHDVPLECLFWTPKVSTGRPSRF